LWWAEGAATLVQQRSAGGNAEGLVLRLLLPVSPSCRSALALRHESTWTQMQPLEKQYRGRRGGRSIEKKEEIIEQPTRQWWSFMPQNNKKEKEKENKQRLICAAAEMLPGSGHRNIQCDSEARLAWTETPAPGQNRFLVCAGLYVQRLCKTRFEANAAMLAKHCQINGCLLEL